MNYLSVENIAKSYGERVLFENVSFGINKDQKIAFIAKNGTGKSTILNIITGRDQSDIGGKIVKRKDIHVAFLSQEDIFDETLTVEETIFASDNKTLNAISLYEKALENPDDGDAYQVAFDLMDSLNAWDFETQYKQILFKLKLDQLDQKVSLLSGGQKKRLALATILINKPDLFILDEPTNHLDLEMIEWLESYFKKESITLFMVTHDRYFLERVCNEIIELENGEIHNYKGNYAYYLEKKEARQAAESTELGKAKSLFKKELDWMRRQPKARTTKSKSRIDDFYEIKEKAHSRRKEHKMELEINMERMGNKVVEFLNVNLAFDEKVILDKFNHNFKKGDRVGIIGKNGTGKTTFLNLLTNTLAPDSGKVITGETIKFGYYNQKGITIKEDQKVIDVIREFGDYIPLSKGRKISASQLLERFLFDKKKQYDQIEKLSGGERKRLYLCTILIQNPNFLILDEPTNDLDIVTLTVLENFLLDFPGCLLVVSHDRYFMDKIVDHLFVFRGEGEVEKFPGNYSDFRSYEDSAVPEKKQDVKKEKNNWKQKNNDNNLTFNEQKEYKNLENDISKLEAKKINLENSFATEEYTPEQIENVSKKIGEFNTQIEEKEFRWLELSSKLEG